MPAEPESRAVSLETRALVVAGVPLALASLGQTLLGSIAVGVAGRLGAPELAAVGLGASVFFMVAAFGTGLLLGLDPVLTQAAGRKDAGTTRRALGTGLMLVPVLALALAAVLLVVLVALKSARLSPATLELVRSYMLGRLPGLLPAFGFVVLRSHAAASGGHRGVLGAVALASLAVLVAAPLLASTSLGIVGLGLAESLGSAAAVLPLAWRARTELLTRREPARPTLVELRAVLDVGVPVGLALVAEYAAFAVLNLLVAAVEPDVLPAHQVAVTWLGTLFMLPVGFGTAALARLGGALGRRDVPAARRIGRSALALSLLIGAGLALPMALLPRELALLVTSDARVVAAAVPLMRIGAVVLVADAAQAVLVALVRAVSDTRSALTAVLIGHYAVGLPVGVTLAAGTSLGALGLWGGLGVGLTTVALLLGARFFRLLRTRSPTVSRSSPSPIPLPAE
jgi:MATE family multidrug resistance protein